MAISTSGSDAVTSRRHWHKVEPNSNVTNRDLDRVRGASQLLHHVHSVRIPRFETLCSRRRVVRPIVPPRPCLFIGSFRGRPHNQSQHGFCDGERAPARDVLTACFGRKPQLRAADAVLAVSDRHADWGMKLTGARRMCPSWSCAHLSSRQGQVVKTSGRLPRAAALSLIVHNAHASTEPG
jgi:hypothetical protein